MPKHKSNTNTILLGITIALFIFILYGMFVVDNRINDLEEKMTINLTDKNTNQTQQVYLNGAMAEIMKTMGIIKVAQ